MKTISISATREAYEPSQLHHTMTVNDLIDCLQEMADAYGEDTLVVVSNDNGYTFGSLGWESVDVYGGEE